MSAHAADAVRRAWPASDSTRVVAQPALDVAAIAALVRPGDAVLLKASRGMGLERAAAAIADAAGR
jgi:UDP-N-acetylmuramyl pentapeptide synthase